jgi:hypothetical protein
MIELTNRVRGNVKTVDTLAGAIEAVVLAIVGRLASWVASIPCAVMTAKACATFFELTWPVAVAVAVALELVGQTTSNLWLNAKEWNASKRKSDPSANEGLAFVLMVSYFVADFLIIVALQLPGFLATRDPSGLTALLFPILAVVGVVALNERIQQYRREANVDAVKEERRAARLHKMSAQQVHKGSGRGAQEGAQNAVLDVINRTRQERKRRVMDELLDAYECTPALGASEAARLVGVHRNTIYNYTAELEATGRLRGNGGGWEVIR